MKTREVYTMLLTLWLMIIEEVSAIIEEKIVSLRMRKLFNLFYVHTQIGFPNQVVLEIMSLKLNYIWTVTHYYNASYSSTSKIVQKTTVLYNSHELEGEDVIDYVSAFDKNFNTSLLFKYVDYADYGKDVGGFGFSYKAADPKYSFLHQLKEKGVIDRLAFGLQWPNHTLEGLLYLGGIPSHVVSYQQRGACQVNLSGDRWGCSLNRISFYNDSSLSYRNTLPSHFKTNEDIINVPLDFYQMLLDTVFKAKIDSEDCASNAQNNLSFITCSEKVIDVLPPIDILFGSTRLAFPLKELFLKEGKYYMFIMQNKQSQNAKWVFGSTFLSLFTVLFDVDNSEVVFFMERGISSLTESELAIDDQRNHYNSGGINEAKGIRAYSIALSIFLLIGVGILTFSYVSFLNKQRS